MGWTKEITKPGNGAKPKKGDKVTVECTGIVQSSGKKFWSTKDPGQEVFSFNIGLGQVIPAWDEGVATMSVGEHATITATHGEISAAHAQLATALKRLGAEVAYGDGGFPAWGIPPRATLIFHIELLKLN